MSEDPKPEETDSSGTDYERFIPANVPGTENRTMWGKVGKNRRRYEFSKDHSLKGHVPPPPSPGYDSEVARRKKAEAETAARRAAAEKAKEEARKRAAASGEPVAPRKRKKKPGARPRSTKAKIKAASPEEVAAAQAKLKAAKANPSINPQSPAPTTEDSWAALVGNRQTKGKLPTYRGRAFKTVEVTHPSGEVSIRPMTASEHINHYSSLSDRAMETNDLVTASGANKSLDFWENEPENWYSMRSSDHADHHLNRLRAAIDAGDDRAEAFHRSSLDYWDTIGSQYGDDWQNSV